MAASFWMDSRWELAAVLATGSAVPSLAALQNVQFVGFERMSGTITAGTVILRIGQTVERFLQQVELI